MSHECTVDCGIEADVDFVDLSADRFTCVGVNRFREVSQVLGEYPLAGDFAKFGFDLVVDQDLEVFQRVEVPIDKVWRVCRSLIINEDGILIVSGIIIIGEE